MRKTWLLLPFLLLATLTAMADGAPEQAAAGTPVAAHVRLRQQLRAHDAEAARLQREVRAQESHSRQAGERLQEQDREIARLQRQLDALNGHPPGGTGGQ